VVWATALRGRSEANAILRQRFREIIDARDGAPMAVRQVEGRGCTGCCGSERAVGMCASISDHVGRENRWGEEAPYKVSCGQHRPKRARDERHHMTVCPNRGYEFNMFKFFENGDRKMGKVEK
jgi:hypothetical protein